MLGKVTTRAITMKQRQLVSIRREILRQQREEYDAAWVRLHAAATARGAHAWRFASASREDLYIEFLESAAEQDPRDDAAVAAALRELETTFGTNAVEEWQAIPE